MNQKFLIVIITVLIWFLVIAGFAFYYIFVNEPSAEVNEQKIQRESNSQVKNEIGKTPSTNTAIPVNNPENKNNDTKNVEPKNNSVTFANKGESIINLNKKEPVKESTIAKPEEKKTEPEEQVVKVEEVGGIKIQGHVIDLKTNKSIEGVAVSFFSHEGNFLKRAITDKDGRFEAKNVKADAIHVRLQKENYISEVYKNFSLDELSQHQLYKMDPGQTIKGIIKEKSSGSPLTGVSVEMYRGNIILKKGESSDAKGNFTITAVPQGKIELVFSKLGFSQASQPLNIDKNPVGSLEILLEKSSSLVIEVVPLNGFELIPKIRVYFDGSQEPKVYDRSILTVDQTKNIFYISGIERQYSKLRINADGFTYPAEKPLTITPGQETRVVFEVEKGLTVSGSVKGVKDNPLPDVNIKVYEVFGGGRAASDDILKSTITSDKNGKFSVTGISPGNIEIVTSSTVYKRFQKKFLIEEKNIPEIDIVLEAESFFVGKVTDKEGQPINITEVRFVPISSDGKYDPKRDRPVFEGTPKLGEFKMSGVTAGLYRFSLTAPGFIAYIDEKYEVKNDQTEGSFQLTKGLSVTGEVKSEGGAPINEAEVRLLVSLKDSNVKYKSVTDYNGFFAVSGLEENVTYKLQVQGKGCQIFEKEIVVKSGVNHYPIVLKNKLSFSGIVLDNYTNLPVPNFQVKILGKYSQGLIDDSTETFNVPNGQFSIPVNSEVFNMELKAPGFALYQLRNIKITDPIQNHYLVKAGSLNVKLMVGKDPGSMKLVQLSTAKDIESDEDKRNVRTDSNGNALIQNLKPGDYYIRVMGVQGFANYDDMVSIQMEVETKKNINLIQGLGVKGRLLNAATNIPITSGEVFLDREKYVRYPIKDYLNPDGFFEFKNVSTGKHQLNINYGPMVNGKFSLNYSMEITVPEFVKNSLGIYQIDDILVK